MKILVVDDDPVCRNCIASALRNYGNVHQAAGGREALEIWQRELPGIPFDVIFLDVFMPDVDGHMVIYAIRKKENEAAVINEKSVKIILVSTATIHVVTNDTFQRECIQFISKPISEDKVTDAMRRAGLAGSERGQC